MADTTIQTAGGETAQLVGRPITDAGAVGELASALALATQSQAAPVVAMLAGQGVATGMPAELLSMLQRAPANTLALPSYTDHMQIVTGREYLHAFHNRCIAGSACTVVLTGDSTTAATGTYRPTGMMQKAATAKNFNNHTFTNRGQSGMSAGDWDTTYVAGDIALSPHLLVVRWGINDPYYGRNLTQFITSMRSALGKVRAALTVDQCSIVLMAPNSTSDTPQGRDKAWHEQVSPALRRLAREYMCTYIDTYAIAQDSINAAGKWMDNPYGDGRAIHPNDTMSLAIMSVVADVVYPSMLGSGGFANYTAAQSTMMVPAAAATVYPLGISISRALTGWPCNGHVLTFRSVEGTAALQVNWSYNSNIGAHVRTGFSSTWSAWHPLSVGPTQTDLALENSWVQYDASSVPRVHLLGKEVRFFGMVKNGTTSAGTRIAAMPAGCAPSSSILRRFALPTDTTGSTATVYATSDGVYLSHTPSNGWIDLSGITYFTS